VSKQEFPGPVGIFLQGGGSLGAWQAGALEVLTGSGLRFAAVMGYSIGVVNGMALAFDRLPHALEHWRRLNGWTLRPGLRLSPFSLCSPRPLRSFFDEALDDEAAKGAIKSEFTIMTACPAEGTALYARFTPGGRDGWDAPIVEHAAASCAVPLVFPAVDLDFRGRRVRLYDGGVPMPKPVDFSPLAACATVLVLEMVKADELGRRERTPWREVEQASREAGRGLVDQGVSSLLAASRPPRVFRLEPSRRLEPMMLDFRRAGVQKMLVQGAEDARALLADPTAYWKK
jgi:predicted acylesterase/phospholipase RssA